jgi:hypothetical protein
LIDFSKKIQIIVKVILAISPARVTTPRNNPEENQKMNENKEIPQWAWDLYQAKQEEACKCPNDATEETLNYLGRVISTGNIPEHISTLKQMVDNYLAGHRQKVRRRLRLLENNADMVVCSDRPTKQNSDCLGIFQRNSTPLQWRLLTGLANGHSYRRLSAGCGLSVASAKSSVCRIRKRLRTLALAE